MNIPRQDDGLETVLEKTGRILTERYGIRVVCRGNRCCTDGKTIFLPALPDDVPEALWNTIRGYIDHESGNHIFRSSFSVAKEFRKKHGDKAFGLLNILEDLRIEHASKRPTEEVEQAAPQRRRMSARAASRAQSRDPGGLA